ncbi:hypothetical protein J2X06_003078 [Lysobacter niastensis]|uniref:DUF5666 domain-containing protein n=1 Tax=Lysobacter niastensis TaxID=380629 RepID=A0ABU1WE42_9GAMM|nr:hypothetical protein [Lysobacter niastensis]MDR7135860.1 hypothetical protein [Lysobacter niastensis]
MKKSLFLGLVALVFAGSAMAQSPKVLVHARKGEVQVAGHAVPKSSSYGAEIGDEVVVNGGEATVTYSNGCAVLVTDRYTVKAATPICAKPVESGMQTETAYILGGAGAAAAAAALLSDGDDKPSSP